MSGVMLLNRNKNREMISHWMGIREQIHKMNCTFRGQLWFVTSPQIGNRLADGEKLLASFEICLSVVSICRKVEHFNHKNTRVEKIIVS